MSLLSRIIHPFTRAGRAQTRANSTERARHLVTGCDFLRAVDDEDAQQMAGLILQVSPHYVLSRPNGTSMLPMVKPQCYLIYDTSVGIEGLERGNLGMGWTTVQASPDIIDSKGDVIGGGMTKKVFACKLVRRVIHSGRHAGWTGISVNMHDLSRGGSFGFTKADHVGKVIAIIDVE